MSTESRSENKQILELNALIELSEAMAQEVELDDLLRANRECLSEFRGDRESLVEGVDRH